MEVMYNKDIFKSEEEWMKVNSDISNMDISEAHEYLIKGGYIEDNRLRVKDMISYLSKMDPETKIAYAELNAEDGLWQYMTKSMLHNVFTTVRDDKEHTKGYYIRPEMSEDEISGVNDECEKKMRKYYKYVNDEDILMRI